MLIFCSVVQHVQIKVLQHLGGTLGHALRHRRANSD